MNIIVRKKDNLVIFCGKTLFINKELVNGGILDNWICTEYNLSNADMVENIKLPEDYQDGIYIYIKGEFIKSKDADLIIKERADAKAKDEFLANAERYAILSKDLLEKSDITVLRCWENNISVPVEWLEYRTILRRIKKGSGETIPTEPEYPKGT